MADVVVHLTLIGPDGGDGGFQSYLTDSAGYARLYHQPIPGRYQYELDYIEKSKYYRTAWHNGESYITLRGNGVARPSTLQLGDTLLGEE